MNTNKPSKNNSPFRSFVVFWLPTFSWVILICYLSLADSDLPEIKFRFILESDKIAHLGFYSVLTFLLVRSWLNIFSAKSLVYILILSSVQAISFSIIMEVLQKLITTTRQFDLTDIYANIAGTVIGAFSYLLIFKLFSKASSAK